MPDDYLVEKIFPSKRVHLLAGISSAGKSRFMLPALILWRMGAPFLGLKSNPVPWCVVCGDRPVADTEDTLKSMGFSPSDVPIIPAFGRNEKSSYGIMSAIKECGAKMAFWEGFDMCVQNPNSSGEVKEMLSRVTSYCEDDLTVLGSVGVAKLKPHEMYQNPRQLVAGSSLWERATSSNLIVVPVNPKDIEDPNRILYVSLKNSPSFTVKGKFNESGILVFDSWKDRIHGNAVEAILNPHARKNA